MKNMIILRYVTVILLCFSLASSCVTTQKQGDPEWEAPAGMVLIPKGWFMMGSEEGEYNERPMHEVYLDDYFIDRYEISSSMFAQLLNEKGNPEGKYFTEDEFATIVSAVVKESDGREKKKFVPRAGLENFPANNISWHGAYEFCSWKGKRLPSEAEWEKAAKGDDEMRQYPWGNALPDDSKARYKVDVKQGEMQVLVPVDSLPSGGSPFGIVNMSGNVWEWVDDWYKQNYCDFCDPESESFTRLASEIACLEKEQDDKECEKLKEQNAENRPAAVSMPPRRNPGGPEVGSFRVLRGGAWDSESEYYIRNTFRFWLDPAERYRNTGFRCAK